MQDELYKMVLYILGDSAYALEYFFIPPYDGTTPQNPQDDFDFFHSSARITVECVFGEIDLRWVIFWKKLCGTLEHSAVIIEVDMHLHNFLVDYREATYGTESDSNDDA